MAQTTDIQDEQSLDLMVHQWWAWFGACQLVQDGQAKGGLVNYTLGHLSERTVLIGYFRYIKVF